MSHADFLVKGAITGMVASAASVVLVHVLIDVGTRWSADGVVVTIVAALLMAAALLVPPIVGAWRNRDAVIDPFFEPDALKPVLQGRSIGIVLGIAFGISVVAGWR
ncbi:hypothetical protein WT21_29665 [Burkholderia territorii]|uniref:Uncharacterized protein n=1 Tax=Burkholderia territorii TaxID=1503055 RepID=A0A124T5V1_9BURK|nr:hypothetical protein [Burkholderia territorii]KAB0684713.1 hypothetical protein F7R13_07620 [Burkholderia territorii]KVK92879.1 hypothetical protein WS94_06775 [Burkholderia territorii]KVL35603.1 hypothetical protein WS97_14365 [Burkholderia territorii]KVL51648.1 hypothetical protein WS99_15615 [Burkholderia territorii]KVQ39019.1 hypothetical protein WT21_29665 [Burkholderia territorii]